jgi:hypothetical protein
MKSGENLYRRQALPKSFRRANVQDTVAIRTTKDAKNSIKNGTLHFVANAIKNTTIFVEIEILDGNLYHGAFDLFADTLRWGVRSPSRTGIPNDYRNMRELSKYSGKPSYEQGPHSFAAVLDKNIMDQQNENLPLNLLNHKFLSERDYLGFGDRVYSLNDTEINLVKGDAHISLDFLLSKSGYDGLIDMTAETNSFPRNYAPAFASSNYTKKITFSTTQADPVGVEPDIRDSIQRGYSDYWNQLTSIAVPYLPFVSNCAGYDSNVPIFQLMEHDNCSLIAPENSQELLDTSNGFSISGVPVNVSDTCDISLICRHEERYNAGSGKIFWFNM